MMQEKNKKVVLAMLSCASVGSFVGCGSGEEVVDSSANTSDHSDVDSVVEIVKNDNLAVDPNKCVGCGKCPRIASANFAMNENRKAEVISQEITSQAKIDRAIDACPVSAITQ